MTARQFETLLRIRRHRRDQVRLALGRILADGRSIEEAARRAASDRDEALADVRSGAAGGVVDIDRASALRFYAGRLSLELAALRGRAAENAARVQRAKSLLARADQAVKTVERLRERDEEQRRREAERRADREATDLYSASSSNR